MKHFIVFSLCLASHLLYGQTAFKLSVNTLRSGVEKEPNFTFPEENNPAFGVAPALVIKSLNNNLYHEIELSRLYVGKEENDIEIIKDFWLSLGYELGAKFASMDFKKLRVRLGGAANLFYGSRDYDTKIQQIIPRDYKSFGIVLSLCPHLEYYFTERFFLDFGPKIGIMSFGFEKTRTYNPNFTEQQQKQGGFELNGHPGLLIQLGIGFTF